jgi:hypothetical protein
MMTVSVVGDRAEADLATQPTTGRLTTGRLPKTGRLPNGLAAELTKSLVSLWTQRVVAFVSSHDRDTVLPTPTPTAPTAPVRTGT